jgi:hypothetical protein
MKMLENTIDCCPDEKWESKFNNVFFWHEANHCMYWIELLTTKWSPINQDKVFDFVDRIGIKEYIYTIS